MSYGVHHTVIAQRLVANWVATRISWEGFNQDKFVPAEGETFIRPRVDDDRSDFVATTGTKVKNRSLHLLEVIVDAPSATGNAAGDGHCRAILALFHRFQSGGLSFWRAGYARELGPTADGTRHRWLVLMPFYTDELV